jgi:amino-acid N-acetyltransferase
VLRVSRSAVSLRPATASDVDALHRLLTEVQLTTAGIAEWWPRFTVAETDQGLIGAAGVETYPDGALLRSVAVHPSMQGTGTGRTLVDRALVTAREAGAQDIYLLTITAENYFPRFGFARIAREMVPDTVQASVEFRGACPESAIVMHRSLRDA